MLLRREHGSRKGLSRVERPQVDRTIVFDLQGGKEKRRLLNSFSMPPRGHGKERRKKELNAKPQRGSE